MSSRYPAFIAAFVGAWMCLTFSGNMAEHWAILTGTALGWACGEAIGFGVRRWNDD